MLCMKYERITDVRAITEIQDSKLTMSDATREATLHVRQSQSTKPLSTGEPHLTLHVSGDDCGTEVELNGEQLDALIDTLYHIQEEYANE